MTPTKDQIYSRLAQEAFGKPLVGNMYRGLVAEAIVSYALPNAPVLIVIKAALLTPQQVQQAKAEVATVDAHPIEVEWMGRRTITHVKEPPYEPVAAESFAWLSK